MALTGFDPEVVKNSITSVTKGYESLISSLGEDMQTKFVDGMSDKWAAKEAQTFFSDAFKPAVDKLISESNRIFESVVKAMNGAASTWARETGGTYTDQTFTPITKTMDISGIQENINGVRGIDQENASTVAGKLPTIAEGAKSALTDAQNAVQNSGFVGGNQASSLIESLATIKNNIDSSTQELTNLSKTAIDNTVKRYGDTAGRVSAAFAGEK